MRGTCYALTANKIEQGMDLSIKRAALLIAVPGNIYLASGATLTGAKTDFDGMLIIAVLIILGLAGTIGLLVYTLARFAVKVRRRFTKNSASI